MNKPLILAIDQGTFSTRSFLYNQEGQVIASAAKKVALKTTASNQVEQDPNEILHSMQEVLNTVLSGSLQSPSDIACAGLATQRSSVLAWSRTDGTPLTPVLSWQDRRGSGWLESKAKQFQKVTELSGLPLSPHYGASKLNWILQNSRKARIAAKNGDLVIGPLGSFLLYHLLEEHPNSIDQVNASRTQLCDIHTGDWSAELGKLFEVPLELLPQIKPVCSTYGNLTQTRIPLTAVNGDQNAALFALGKPSQGTAFINLGTGAFILSPVGTVPTIHPPLVSSIASGNSSQRNYTLEGTVNGSGLALEWAIQKWDVKRALEQIPAWLSQKGKVPIFINTLGGLGSPYWAPEAQPLLIGEGDKGQKIVAVLESILFLLQINLEILETVTPPIKQLQISGGLSHFDGVCQRLADLSQRTVYRPASVEATARGIAWLASSSPKYWPKPGRGKRFYPSDNPELQGRFLYFQRELEKQLQRESMLI